MSNDTVLPYPKEFFPLLNVFKACFFDKRQFNNFCQVTSGLAVSSSKFVITRLSKIFVERGNSSLSKFLTQSPWDEDNVKLRLHKLLFKLMPDLDVFIGDDTLAEKPFAKAMEGVDSHYSGLKKKHCNGHSIVTTGFHTEEGFVPFDGQMYLRKEKAAELGRPFKTKNEIMSEKLLSASEMCDFNYAVFDTWYSNNIVIGTVKQLRKKFVTQIKSNRNVTIKRRKRLARDHCKDIPIANHVYRIINGNLFRYYETDGFISKIGSIRLFYCQMLIEEKDRISWSDMNYIISNDLESPSEFLIKTYLKRNSIEPFHREGKQQLGMDKYQLGNIRGIEKYLFLVILTYTLLMLLNQLLMQQGKSRQTIGEIKIYLREDCYTSLLRKAKIQKIEVKQRIAHNLAYAL